jgi:hypothetical protein
MTAPRLSTMGYQVIKQPDGLLAIFSSYTDTWAVYDATPEEVAEWFAGRAAATARSDAERIVGHVMAGNAREVYCQFAMSYEEANADSREHGGVVLPVAEPVPEPGGASNYTSDIPLGGTRPSLSTSPDRAPPTSVREADTSMPRNYTDVKARPEPSRSTQPPGTAGGAGGGAAAGVGVARGPGCCRSSSSVSKSAMARS